MIRTATVYSRFLAGGESLKKFRKVARKDMLLSSLNSKHDSQSLELNRQVGSYLSAVNLLSSEHHLNVPSIIAAHKMMTSDSNMWGLRTYNAWIGKSGRSKATYNAPPANMVQDLLDELVEFVNSSELEREDLSIIAYMQLLTIHPFGDGNGRVARAVFESLMNEKSDLFIHLVLFRLHTTKEEYSECHKYFRRGDFKLYKPDNCIFWSKAKNWGKKIADGYQFEFDNLIKPIYRSIEEEGFSECGKKAMQLFEVQPIANFGFFIDNLDYPHEEITAAITSLVAKEIVVIMTSNLVEDNVLFVFKNGLEFFLKTEALIFSNSI